MTAIIIAIGVPVLATVISITYIAVEYIIKPHKSIRDGLHDWARESANDR